MVEQRSKVIVPLYTVMYESSSCSIFFSVVSLSFGLIVILICIFPLMNTVLNIFYVHIHHLNIFFIELFVFLLLSCKGSLHILDLSPLSGFIGNILSLSVACLFIFLIVTLQRTRFFKNSFQTEEFYLFMFWPRHAACGIFPDW